MRVTTPVPDEPRGRLRALCAVLGFCFALAAFPYLRLSLGVVEISPMHVVLILVFGAACLRGVRDANRTWVLAVLLFVLFCAANLIQVTGDTVSLARGVRFLIRLAAVVIMAIGAVNLGARYHACTEYVFSVVANVVFAIGAALFVVSFFIFGDDYINVSLIPTAGYDRGQSSFAFALASVIALGLYLRTPGLWRLGRFLGLLVLTALGGARGPALMCALGVAVLVALDFRLSHAKWMVVVIAALVVLSPAMPQRLGDRFLRLEHVFRWQGADSHLDLSYRDELFRIAFFDALPKAPLVGTGTGSSPRVNGRYYSLGKPVDPHSDYNLVAIEDGLVGLVLLGIMQSLTLSIAFRALRSHRDGRSRTIVATYAALLIVCFGTSAIDTLLDLSHVWLLIGLMQGFILHCRVERVHVARAPVATAAVAEA